MQKTKKKKKAKTISDFDEKDIFLLNKIDDRKIERERERERHNRATTER